MGHSAAHPHAHGAVRHGVLSNPSDVAVLTDPHLRDTMAEAILVSVKRLYLMDKDTQPTGTYTFTELLAQEAAHS